MGLCVRGYPRPLEAQLGGRVDAIGPVDLSAGVRL